MKIPQAPSRWEETLALQIRVMGLPEPVREHRFDPVRKWRFDFAWPEQLVAVEVEGGIKSRGRHVRPEGFTRDAEKYNAAAVAGWRLLRFTSAMVGSGEAVRQLKAVLK